MGNLETHAENELKLIGAFDSDGAYGGMLGEAVMKMIREFAAEGHSGNSAKMTLRLFEKCANFEPLSPLTGSDDEWTEVFPGEFQNKRCPHVFKDSSGAYDSTGKIFRDPDGSCYQNSGSRVPITFPYVPKTEYVDRASE